MLIFNYLRKRPFYYDINQSFLQLLESLDAEDRKEVLILIKVKLKQSKYD